MAGISERLLAVVNALPLRAGMRVLEIGCGPGAAAREVSTRIGAGYVLGIDRSPKAIAQARVACAAELRAQRMGLRCVAVEDFVLQSGEAPYDLAFAARVGALDGRHPEREARAVERIRAALSGKGALFVGDGAAMHARR
jgi:cyclopropane fatty-acyl-phospholipid synthase-like methyltransferase